MAEAAIQFENVSKQFGRRRNVVRAVHEATFRVAPQQVYGFLGPNGAGKSTTIRMINGLVHPTQGRILVFGQDVQQETAVLQRVGALIEGATFYPYLTGRKNLAILAQTAGLAENGRLEALLHMVGLGDRADRPVRGYSTGMKQRLGVAAALLGDPELIILDEPTNGLDPAGIQEMRSLIRRLVDEEQKTVFLSSHLLNEVEQVCDRVAIINKGHIIHEGTVSDLQNAQHQLRLDVNPLEKAQAVIAASWGCEVKNGRLLVYIPREEIPTLVAALVAQQIELFEMETIRQSLESFFLQVTTQPEATDE